MVNMKLDKRNEQLIDSLKNLKLHGMAEDLKNQFENEGLYSTVTFSNRLEQMINKQLSYVAERKYASLPSLALQIKEKGLRKPGKPRFIFI